MNAASVTFPENGRRLVWEVTHECGRGCPYCFQERKRLCNPVRILSKQDLERVCSVLAGLEVTDVLLTGGEVWHVREELKFVCTRLTGLGLPISFSTSHLSDGQFIQQLISLGPRCLNLSLDPRGAESDERFRGYLDQVESVLGECDSAGVEVKITGVITRENVDGYPEYEKLIGRMTRKHSCLRSVYVTNPYEIGFEKAGIRATHNALKKLLAAANPPNRRAVMKFVNFPRFNMALQQCHAGSRYLHIEPNGDVYPCHLLANLYPEYYRMGNVIRDRSEDIDSNLRVFGEQVDGMIAEYKHTTEQCKRCNEAPKCNGGCVAELISLGDLVEPHFVCREIAPAKRPPAKRRQRLLQLKLNGSAEDILQDEEGKIRAHIQTHIRRRERDLSHGFDHIECVVGLARYIAEREKADLRIVTAAAYFHDFEPRRRLLFENHTKLSADRAAEFLRGIGFSEAELDQVHDCIVTSSYGAFELNQMPGSKEAEVVRDADWLDAIGARGIARAFAFAAAHGAESLGRCDWDPQDPPDKRMSLVGPDPSPIYHFASKLLRVKDRIRTATGRRLAEERHTRMVRFLEDYKKEMAEDGESGRG